MAEFAPGLIQGGEALSRDRYRQAQIDEAMKMLAMREQLFQQQQQATQRAQGLHQGAMQLPPMMDAPPVQAMPPGQASMPQQPQGPPPGAGAFGPPGGQPNPMLGQQPPVPMLAGGGGGTPPTQGPPPGWQVGGTATPKLGGPDMPQGQPGIMPRQLIDPLDQVQKAIARGVTGDQLQTWYAENKPVWDASNKARMDESELKVRVEQAKERAAKAAKEKWELEHPKPTAEQQNALFITGGDVPSAQKLMGAVMERRAIPPGGGQGAGGYGAEFEKLNPRQQGVVDWYATMDLGGDRTWRVGLSRVSGGAQIIKAVDEYVPIKAGELGLSAADVGTSKAIRVASQSALTQNTKDLATLKPYVDMLHQNADILKGLAKKAIATNAALANKPLNWIRTNAADSPDVAEYLAQVEIVKNEATRVISNPRLVGQMTDTARQEIEAIINGTMPLNATERVLERIKNDGDRRLTTMETQQKSLESKIKEMYPGGATTGSSGETPAAKTPNKGDVVKGYRFKGGDPSKQENWEKI